MSTEMVVAVMSSLSSLLVAIVSVIANNRVLGFKVDELKKQVEKHNGLVERMAVVERDLKTSFNRIDEQRQEIRELKNK